MQIIDLIIIQHKDRGRADLLALQIAHIDCNQDTYKDLAKSITGSLNEGMKTLIQAGGVKLDCDLTTKKGSVSAISGWVPTKNEISQSLPIKISISGNL
eukprot:12013164-Ditylum_brightwellii.AAC.1